MVIAEAENYSGGFEAGIDSLCGESMTQRTHSLSPKKYFPEKEAIAFCARIRAATRFNKMIRILFRHNEKQNLVLITQLSLFHSIR